MGKKLETDRQTAGQRSGFIRLPFEQHILCLEKHAKPSVAAIVIVIATAVINNPTNKCIDGHRSHRHASQPQNEIEGGECFFNVGTCAAPPRYQIGKHTYSDD
ncbi:hypothetical protein EVAR_18391_1 [Eumeta japonica]|uniref:Uncharacterized protein n=1 Tax=Eumeta variegata TaxID=151549 RepID=A0A4C1UTW8_EUMVA|nr:hypothetical protein EVAR_18391_1 [Eumeta japonica]